MMPKLSSCITENQKPIIGNEEKEMLLKDTKEWKEINKRMDDAQHMVSEYSKGLANVMSLINSKADKDAIQEYVNDIKSDLEDSIEATDDNLSSSDDRIEELETLVETLTARLDAIAPTPLEVAAKHYSEYVKSKFVITSGTCRILRDKKLLLL